MKKMHTAMQLALQDIANSMQATQYDYTANMLRNKQTTALNQQLQLHKVNKQNHKK